MRLGHTSNPVVIRISKQCNVSNSSYTTTNCCDACQYGKSHALVFHYVHNQNNQPLQIIHTDLWGLSPLTSQLGFRYYIHFIDDFTRFTWIFP